MTKVEWESKEARSDSAEKRALFGALDSFYQYAKAAHYNTTHVRRQSFYALPRAHWELLASPPFCFLDTLNAVDDGIDKNAELAEAILKAGVDSFGISSSETSEWRGKATSNDHEKARSTLRQFYRDWSEEGTAERETCYSAVIEALRIEEQHRDKDAPNLKILVPGAGLGRLVFELCALGYNTEGNEISFHQLLGSSYILNHCPQPKIHTIFPWIHSFSNHKSRADQLASYLIPDVHPHTVLNILNEPGEMSMSASDFTMLYSREEQRGVFDAVATVFFLDTAPNIIRYFETIKHCLKTGGVLINIGPLLWHFENNHPGSHTSDDDTQASQGIADPGGVELSDIEVVALIEKMGFTIEKLIDGVPTPYIQSRTSMIQNIYRSSHWVARKN